jgi:hypothetical protein
MKHRKLTKEDRKLSGWFRCSDCDKMRKAGYDSRWRILNEDEDVLVCGLCFEKSKRRAW